MSQSATVKITLPSSPKKNPLAPKRKPPPQKLSSRSSSPDWSDSPPKRKKMIVATEDETLFKLPNCPICLGPLSLPVVDTDCCLVQICERCIVECVATGADYSKGPRCPCCNRCPLRYRQSAVFNRLLGQQEVACSNAAQGCQQKVAIADMQQHLDKFCSFTAVDCAHAAYGCGWRGFRPQLADHAAACQHASGAKIIEVYRAKEREMASMLEALQARCDAAEARIERTIAKFNGEVAKRSAELRETQKLHVDGLTQSYVITPKPNDRALRVRRIGQKASTDASVLLVLSLKVEDAQCVLRLLATEPKLDYPFWVGGYIVCLNQGVAALQAASHFCFRFGSSRDSTELLRIDKRSLELGVGESGRRQVEPIMLQLLVSAYSA